MMRGLNHFRALVAGAAALAASLLVAAGEPAQAAFPGLNGSIVFTSDRATSDQDRASNQLNDEIYMMNSDGTEPERLTNTPAVAYFLPTKFPVDNFPALSPDGTKIAFVSNRDSTLDGTGRFVNNNEIYVMDAKDRDEDDNGDNLTRLTNDPPDRAVSDGNPVWSPDGSQIAFTRGSGSAAEVYAMNADGSNPKNLTNNPGAFDGHPVFSPDGTSIAFSSDRTTGTGVDNPTRDFEIFGMNANGTGLTQLTNNTASDTQPNFSPDGSQIAFQSTRDGNFEIYVMNKDGTGQTNLTKDPADKVDSDRFPAWSPDGTKIAFTRGVNFNVGEIWTMNADGSGTPTNLTENTVGDIDPDWQPVFYDFHGFFSPVNNLPTLNLAKAGSAIPVKFSLSGYQGLDIFADGYPNSQQIACDSGAPVDAIEETVTANASGLTYDASNDQYTYVWKTSKAWAGTCRQLVVKLKDSTEHKSNVEFK
jgi:Tol biopolymer transport system component